MLQYSICAFLAPALVSAAASLWAGPQPTLVMPKRDNWSPAPTEAPKIGALELLRRANDNTCGYISGDLESSLTCNDPSYVCATNDFYGVHGCCDEASMDACSLYTTCIDSASMSALCTGDCESNDYIAKCTYSDYPFCYEWHYNYGTTVMTEHGCDSEAFIISASRSADEESGSPISETPDTLTDVEVAVTVFTTIERSITADSSTIQSATSSSTSTTSTSDPIGGDAQPKKKSTNVGAIAGGVVGGLAALGALAFGIGFFIIRKRKQANGAAAAAPGPHGPAPGVSEYKPQANHYGSPQQYPASPQPYPGAMSPQQHPTATTGYYNQEQQDTKQAWAHVAPTDHSTPATPAPQYIPIGPADVPAGVAEAGGEAVQPSNPPQPHQQPHPPSNVYEAP